MRKKEKETPREDKAAVSAHQVKQPDERAPESQKGEPGQLGQQNDELQKDKSGLQTEVDNLRREKEDLFGRLQRLSADYANFQKRVPKQISDSIAYEKEQIVKVLLPVLDDFERTLHNAQAGNSTEAIVKGIQIVHDKLVDVLRSQGIERVKAVGEKFDPGVHEAMMQRCEPDKHDDVVLEEIQNGYKLNGRVIRPSKVVVNKLQAERAGRQEASADEFETTDTE